MGSAQSKQGRQCKPRALPYRVLCTAEMLQTAEVEQPGRLWAGKSERRHV